MSCIHESPPPAAEQPDSQGVGAESVHLEVHRFTVPISYGETSFDENVFLIVDTTSKQCLIVDPGRQCPELEEFIAESGASVKAILNTHGHSDHTAGNGLYRDKYRTGVHAHSAARSFYEGVDDIATHWISGDCELKLGVFNVQVLHTPGHTPGSVCFLIDGRLFSGDTLFARSIGRTPDDFATTRLVENIKQKLLTLPMDTVVYPGHGDKTTIAVEKRENPFLSEG
jgi:hydroxyacylglutathione hydrolase